VGKLVNCQACKKKISINAPSCPNCGEPNTPKKKNSSSGIPKWVWLLAVVFAIVIAANQPDKSGTQLSPEEQKIQQEQRQRAAVAQARLDAKKKQLVDAINIASADLRDQIYKLHYISSRSDREWKYDKQEVLGRDPDSGSFRVCLTYKKENHFGGYDKKEYMRSYNKDGSRQLEQVFNSCW